jgi:hypothetical protein
LLAEMAEQEENFAQGLEDYRGILKQIRNTEGSVQPSRDHKTKVTYPTAPIPLPLIPNICRYIY